VIQSELRLEAGEAPSLEPADFAGCTVFFGFSAPGLLDLRPTPLSRVAPGVEIHATVLDNLMTGDFLQEAPRGLVVLATLVLALLSVLLMVASRKAWQSVALLVVLLPLPALAGMAAYGRGFWWPVVVGEVAVALSAVGGLVLNYATEGRQRQFIKQAFKFYLSPHVIEQILRNPSQLTLGGERRELTILFSDLQGFTAISEKLDPQTLTALLNDYLSDMTDIVLQEGGTLDKYEGDAFIAFWNAPLDQPDHAVRACHAAWRCQQKLGERRREFQQRTGVELRMRIGLHTGEVIVGNMGSRQRFNYTVLGDAANLASRLEGANKAFGTFVMLSETTRSQAAGQIAVREVGLLRVVGRQTPVRVFELLGLAPEGATRSARDLPAAATGEKGPMTIPAADPSGEPATARFAEFARGLALCREGKLGEALAVFEGIPDDPVSQAYGRQCRKVLAATGPPWDAVWNLAEK
jgi:adenylate cyclase